MKSALPALKDSLLDTDLYKFTMMQVVYRRFPEVDAGFAFRCRTPGVNFSPIVGAVRREIEKLCGLTLTDAEINHLKSLGFFRDDFLAFLRGFKLKCRHIRISQDKDGGLGILIQGPWLRTILFEVPVLDAVIRCYYEHLLSLSRKKEKGFWREGEKRLANKVKMIQALKAEDFKFSEFGTRRRFSRAWQACVVETLAKELPRNFSGTSNILLAWRYGLRPVGTMAHEFLEAPQALVGIRQSQKFALKTWLQEYQGKLGIALTDVIGVDAFLGDFDGELARRFDGLRQDSGDPFSWATKIIRHYRKLGIDPRTKTAVFSDGLDVPRAIGIYKKFHHKLHCSFGIGTNLTNDMGLQPIQVVIKMTHCQGKPVGKITDSPEKQTLENPIYLKRLARVFEVEKTAFLQHETFSGKFIGL